LKEEKSRGVLDTNIILRHIIQDDPHQSKLATGFFKKLLSGKDKLYVTSITFAELVWVMESVYEYEKEEVASILKPLFNTPNLEFENREALQEALFLYKSLKVDYADCYNACYARLHDIVNIYSFDKDYNKFKFLNRLEPG